MLLEVRFEGCAGKKVSGGGKNMYRRAEVQRVRRGDVCRMDNATYLTMPLLGIYPGEMKMYIPKRINMNIHSGLKIA